MRSHKSETSTNFKFQISDLFRLSVFGFLLSTVAFVLFFAPLRAQAGFDPFGEVCQNTPNADVCQDRTTENPVTGNDGILPTVIEILAIVTAIISIFIIAIAGLTMILSSGNPGRVQASRDAIIYALIALAVAAAAQAIVVFVIRQVTTN